ncbi:MAG: mitochondrial fission ELM1 family protein [Candidatus Omnitrophica bacterium]|nr:mitochondrial fission ELM1 family protein [Candidatus Omnitrophota bacterium]
MRLLPHAAAVWVGRRAGDLGFMCLAKRRLVAFRNLLFAFGGEMDAAGAMVLVRRVFQYAAQSAVEVMRFPLLSGDRIRSHYRMDGEENIRRAIEKGKGVIFLTAHFGNWEMSSFGAAWLGYPVMVLAREQKHARLNQYVNRLRALSGCEVITKGFEVRRIVAHVRENGGAGILSDQDSGANGVWVRFFGRLTSTPRGAFEIARRTGCALLPTFVVRDTQGRHVSHILPDIGGDTSGESDEEWITRRAQVFTGHLESFIRKNPEQWLWLHKRWKSTPQDRVWILSDGKAGHLNQSRAIAGRVVRVARTRALKRIRALAAHFSDDGPGPGPPRVEPAGAGSGPASWRVSEIHYRSKRARVWLALKTFFLRPSPGAAWRWLEKALTPASFGSLRGACADFFISCGSSVAAVNRLLGRATNSKTICVMRPAFPAPAHFDLVIQPRHDRPSRPSAGTRVVLTDTAPSPVLEDGVERLKVDSRMRFPNLQKERYLGLCLGGPADGFYHERGELERLLDVLMTAAGKRGWGLLVTTSRRTEPAIERFVAERLNGCGACDLVVIPNRQNPPGAMDAILSLSDVLVISEDSFSMVSEALALKKRVLVYEVGRIGTPKHVRSLKRLEGEGRLVRAKLIELEQALNNMLDQVPGPRSQVPSLKSQVPGLASRFPLPASRFPVTDDARIEEAIEALL